jgi:hypothetical protein
MPASRDCVPFRVSAGRLVADPRRCRNCVIVCRPLALPQPGVIASAPANAMRARWLDLRRYAAGSSSAMICCRHSTPSLVHPRHLLLL